MKKLNLTDLERTSVRVTFSVWRFVGPAATPTL